MRHPALAALALLGLLASTGAQASAKDPLASVPALPYTLVAKRPHDRYLFTQGMAFHGESLVESGGNYRESRVLVRALEQPSPKVQQRMPALWFGEGLAVHDDRVTVLTWRENVAQVYSLPDLRPITRFRYEGEGWGLTWDGTQFIHSDGSERLLWRDARDFSVQRSLTVRAGGEPLRMLNELEWVEGRLFANVWLTDAIAVIDPADGKVIARIDLQALLGPAEKRRADVLNGIAWQASQRLLWVSGKNWPWMFALRIDLPAVSMRPQTPK
jgi:glutamine cyclotransferase